MNGLVALGKSIAASKPGKWAVKYAPQILCTTGIVSGAGALVATVFSTKRTVDMIDVEKTRRAQEQNVPKEDIVLTKIEVVKIGWKNYILATGLAIGSAAAFIGAFTVEHGRALSLAAVLGATESRLASMEAAINEKLSDNKVIEIKEAAAQKTVDQLDINTPTSEIKDLGGTGDYWIICPASKIKIRGTYDKIQLAIANCDRQLELAAANGWDDSVVSIADFLEEVGAKPWDIPNTMKNLVWRSGDTTNIGVGVSTTTDDNMEPCYILDYSRIRPKWDDLYSF